MEIDKATNYITRLVDAQTATVEKWKGCELQCTYTVAYGKCNCPSGSHRGDCKHINIVLRARNAKSIPVTEAEAVRLSGLLTEKLISSAALQNVEVDRFVKDSNGFVTEVRMSASGLDLPETMTLRGYKEGLAFLIRCVKVE